MLRHRSGQLKGNPNFYGILCRLPKPAWDPVSQQSAFRFDVCSRRSTLSGMVTDNQNSSAPSFLARLALACRSFWRTLTQPDFARQVGPLTRRPATGAEAGRIAARTGACLGPAVLSLLQREGRLIDFLQEDVASFSDADVGAAARVVHGGCRKSLRAVPCVRARAQGSRRGDRRLCPPASMRSASGSPAMSPGQPPFRGTLKHHGWVTTDSAHARRFGGHGPAGARARPRSNFETRPLSPSVILHVLNPCLVTPSELIWAPRTPRCPISTWTQPRGAAAEQTMLAIPQVDGSWHGRREPLLPSFLYLPNEQEFPAGASGAAVGQEAGAARRG